MRQLQVERELQLAGNRSLAEHNMKQAPKLTECKDRLRKLYQQLNEQTKRFEDNKINLGMLFIYVIRWHLKGVLWKSIHGFYQLDYYISRPLFDYMYFS